MQAEIKSWLYFFCASHFFATFIGPPYRNSQIKLLSFAFFHTVGVGNVDFRLTVVKIYFMCYPYVCSMPLKYIYYSWPIRILVPHMFLCFGVIYVCVVCVHTHTHFYC